MKSQKKTVLVLEDEKLLMEIIADKLQSEGFRVVPEREAQKALSYLKAGAKIDMIWLDHYLFGRMNGLDFIAELKLDKSLKNLPIFVVSNTVSPEKVKLYLALGVQGYYTKVDFRLDKIIADIKKLLN